MMATGRVIEDSDEDEDGGPNCIDSLEATLEIKQGRLGEDGDGSMLQTSSTDPVLFQALYDQHLGVAAMRSIEFRSDLESPAVENITSDQTISSSVTSARKLKRRRTLNVSSLTSISEPTSSNRRAKRAKSMKDVDDLTQVTTPRRLQPGKDQWEFPSSSISGSSRNQGSEVESRNAEKNTPLKTYGRLQRSKTFVDIKTAHTINWPIPLSTGEESTEAEDVRPYLANTTEHNLVPTLPKSKKQKRDVSEIQDLLVEDNRSFLSCLQKDAFSTSNDMVNKIAEPETLQVLCSTNEGPSVKPADSSIGQFIESNVDNSSILAKRNSAVEDLDPKTISYLDQTSLKTMSSIVIIPTVLTEKQKMQYDVVCVSSTAGSRRSSLPEMMDPVDPNMKYSGDSSTILNETPITRISSQTTQTRASAALLTSSPPASSVKLRLTRANSEVSLKGQIPSSISNSSGNATKRRAKSNAVAPEDTPSVREASFDELSLSPMKPTDMTILKNDAVKISQRKSQQAVKEMRVDADEHFSSDDIEPPAELYRPRPSVRRSKSMYMRSMNDGADPVVPQVKPADLKSAEVVKPCEVEPLRGGVLLLDGAINDQLTAAIEEVDAKENWVRREELQEHVGKMLHPAEEARPVPLKPIVPAPPKKRGRKKTSEIIASKVKDPPEPPNQELFQEVRKVLSAEPFILCETNSNIRLTEPPISTPSLEQIPRVNSPVTPPKTTATEQMGKLAAQTPTKEAKRCLDQHSPLPNGKVPYRVGLSKRTRIAPLLKMIRK